MRILMMTNSYAPVIGGIEESVRSFSEEFRKQGHRVVIVAPTFEGMDTKEKDVIRVPAIQNFLKEDISVSLPIPLFLSRFMKEFQPEIIHSHHFFLVGDMALRLSRLQHVPLVFTHHIMLDQYVDLLPVHTEMVKRFVLKLATGYANLCDCVITPSQTVRDMLARDGVNRPLRIIPTGVDVHKFSKADREGFRKQWNIPQDAFVVGTVGRLNPEKNLEFLAGAISSYLRQDQQAHCVIVGDGTLTNKIRNIFKEAGVQERLHMTGVLKDQSLINAYHAMDVFAFSSHTETQGIVLLESLAAGTPVAAIAASAVQELIQDFKNGRMIFAEDEVQFTETLAWFARLDTTQHENMKQAARATAVENSIQKCAGRLMDIYQELKFKNEDPDKRNTVWDMVKDSLKAEKDLLKNALEATEAALKRN